MLVAAAVCPHPPLLIPAAMGAAGLDDAGLDAAAPADAEPDAAGRDAAGRDGAGLDRAGAADAEVRELRACCAAAVAGLLAAGPDLVIVVGGAAQSAVYAGHVTGSLRSFGIPAAAGSAEPGGPALPLSLTVGAWLLDQADEKRARGASQPASDRPGGRPGHEPVGRPSHGHRDGHGGGSSDGHRGGSSGGSGDGHGGAVPWRRQFRAVASGLPPAGCLRLGAELAGLAPRVALLAMGDASARKAAGVHGAADPAAERYDAEVAVALAAADPGRLAALDPALDDELMIAGRAAWQVLAGAAAGASLRGRLHCAVAPYDVSYLVASWDSAAAVP